MSEPVVVVVHSRVKDGSEEAFLACHDRLSDAQAHFEGYVGTTLLPPIEGVQDDWVTLFSYDTTEHLDTWLDSSERATLVREVRAHVDEQEDVRRVSAYDGWFGPPGASAPPAWKINYLILLGLYPLVMLEIIFLNPFLAWMDRAPSALVGITFSIGILGWPVVAQLRRWMAWWLDPAPDAPAGTDLRGALVVLAAVAVLVVLFSVLGSVVHIDPVTELRS